MSAPVYDQAFALLERSFKDAHFLKAYKSLPSRQPSESADSPAQSDISEDEDSDDSASMHEGYGNHNLPHITLMRSNSILPPTPPAIQPDTESLRPQLVPLPKENSRLSTPLNQQGPPTPDLTPPNTRTKDLAPPRPSLLHHYPSSRAESFITARESQSRASANESRSSLVLGSDAANTWLDATRSMRLEGLHLDHRVSASQSWDKTRSGEATPTQEIQNGLLQSNVSIEKPTCQAPNRIDSSTPDLANPELMKNVTVRKKRHRKLQPHASDDHETPTGHEKRSQSGRVPQPTSSKEPPPTTRNDEKLDRSDVSHDHLYRHMGDEKSKRLSGASTKSTVVEAIVLSSPVERQRQPTLRRVSGQVSLRDDTSSKRSSLDSTATCQHVLKHKKSPIPGRAYLIEDTLRSVSNPESRHHHNVQRLETPQDYRSFTVPEKRLRHAKPREDKHVKNDSPTIEARVAAAHNQSWLDDPSRTKLRHVSAPTYANGTLVNGSPRDVYRRTSGADAKPPLGSNQGWKRHSMDADLESSELQRSSKPYGGSKQVSGRHVSRDVSPLKGHNASTNALFEYSTKSPTHTSSEWKDGLQLHPSVTPVSISQMSDRTDTMEVTEATAVNLYPHENKSLLVVQHGDKPQAARPQPRPIDEIFTPESDGEQAEHFSTHPVFHAFVSPPDVFPSVEVPDRFEVDSPLRNPRAAPQPPRLPVINFISATPVPEDDEVTEKNASQLEPPPPSRRPSLVEQVRRYSENLIQPFLARSSSRRSTSSQRPQTALDRNITLHPLWRPRGFWDDFESDEDYDDYDDEPLPAGGDTSSIHTIDSSSNNNKPQSWLWSPRRLSVRMRGFAGSGGFMLGNSLGIDRHGTNNRRPYITMPTLRKNNNTISTPKNKDRSTCSTPQSFLHILPTLRRRKSTDLLRKAAQSTESLRRLNQRHTRRRFREWDSRYGVTAVRNKVKRRKERKEEERRQSYKQEIKKRIGMPVYMDGVI